MQRVARALPETTEHALVVLELARQLVVTFLHVDAPEAGKATTVTVHKDPNCGGCTGWVQHLRESGFTVRVEETSDLDAVRSRLGVPPDLAACHTAEVAGYVVEGHVPAAAVRRLLAERPSAKGSPFPGCR